MKERYLSKMPFLTFVYISKCNINLLGYFGNSKKRFLWTGLMNTHNLYDERFQNHLSNRVAHLNWLVIWAYLWFSCIYAFFPHMLISAYSHTLCGFVYVVSCGYAHINPHKPQQHMRIWKTTAWPTLVPTCGVETGMYYHKYKTIKSVLFRRMINTPYLSNPQSNK